MNNSKVREIIKFSFYKNIQNKWFILFNILTLISVVIMLNWSSISTVFKINEEEKIFNIAVLDNNNLIYESFIEEFSKETNIEISEEIINLNALESLGKEALEGNINISKPNNEEIKFNVSRITKNEYTAENIPDDLAIIEIFPDEKEMFNVSIISKEGIKAEYYNPVKNALFNVRNQLFVEEYNLPEENIQILQSDLNINRIMLSVNAEDSNTKELIKLFSSALTYMLTVFIFSKMANEIAQEKQSKSTEYILTTVSAKEYLFAKIFSNIAVLIIQGLLLFVYYFIASIILQITNSIGTDLALNTSVLATPISMDIVGYLVALIVYNVLNLILLCIIQATLSAKTSSTSEAGNTVSLLVFLMLALYVATVYIITPYTKVNLLLYIVSCLPILSAYFVPGMMVVGQATPWQIIISLVILIISIPVLFNFCSRIFKNGILDYTKVKKKLPKKLSVDEENKKFLLKRTMKNLGFVIGTSIIIYIGIQSILSLIASFVLPTIFENILNETDISLVLQMILQIFSLGLASVFVFSYVDKDSKTGIKRADVTETNEKNSNSSGANDKETTGIANAKENGPKKISLKQKIKIVFISVLLIFGLQFILSLVVYPAIGLDYSTTDLFEVTSNSSVISKIILVLAIAVTPAIFEELFFRKAIIDFTVQYGKKFALIFSALLFGLLHMNLSQGLFAFVIGLVFGGIYLYTKDIKLTIFIHFINNGFAALELILPEEWGVVIAGVLLISLIVGFVLLVVMLAKKEKRQKIINLAKTQVSLKSGINRFRYIFTDYTFDVALILVILMSILTEKILR